MVKAGPGGDPCHRLAVPGCATIPISAEAQQGVVAGRFEMPAAGDRAHKVPGITARPRAMR